MTQFKKSAKSVGMIMILTLGSKVLGFLREALIAAKYGSGAATDTFFIALSTVLLFSMLVTETINTILIPVLSEIEVEDGKKEKIHYLNIFLNTIILVTLLLASVAFLLTPYIIRIVGSGFADTQFEYTVLLTRLGLPIIIVSSVVGVFRGYLQSEERFSESAIADYPWNLVYILFLLTLAQYFSITALMVIAVVAETAKLLVQVPILKKNDYRYQFTIDLQNEYMRKIYALIPPVLLSVGITDLNNLVDKSMASTLVEGSISALNYAGVLNSIVYGIFIIPICTVIFPILSKKASSKNYSELKKIIGVSLNIVLLITIPAAIGMIVLSDSVVRFAYQRGEFGELARIMTSSALVYYSLGLIGMGVKVLLTRVFYALQEAKIPMKNTIYTLLLNIAFNLLFIRPMGHDGLALASSLSNTLTAIMLLYSLRKEIGALGLRKIIHSSIKILVSSVIMGSAVYLSYYYLIARSNPGRLTELLFVSLIVLVGVLIYLAALYALKVDEMHYLMDKVQEQIKMRKKDNQ